MLEYSKFYKYSNYWTVCTWTNCIYNFCNLTCYFSIINLINSMLSNLKFLKVSGNILAEGIAVVYFHVGLSCCIHVVHGRAVWRDGVAHLRLSLRGKVSSCDSPTLVAIFGPFDVQDFHFLPTLHHLLPRSSIGKRFGLNVISLIVGMSNNSTLYEALSFRQFLRK